MKTTLLLILIVIFFPINAAAAENIDVPFNIGIQSGFNINIHQPDININDNNYSAGIPAVFDENKSDFNLSAGFIATVPLGDYIAISGRFGFNNLSSEYTKHSLADTNLINSFPYTLQYIDITPVLQLHNLLPAKKVYFLTGVSIGIPISNKYSLHQQNMDPPPFPEDQTVVNRVVQDRLEIPDTRERIALLAGVGYLGQVSDFLYIPIEVSYRIPFGDISDNSQFQNWKISQLRLGIGFTLKLF